MLIDPTGLFYGERISACSDEAQLHYPRLMAASNGYGRIEMSVAKLHETVYANFKIKPSREDLQKWFREYHANFLLFVYVAPTGGVWGQWVISRGKLPKWKTAEDKRSPAPRDDEFEAFQSAYVEAKRAKYAKQREHITIFEDFQSLPKASEDFGRLQRTSEDFQSLQNSSEDFGRLQKPSEVFRSLPRGEVEVEVVGEVEEEVFAPPSASPVSSSSSSPIFTACRHAIQDYWAKHVMPGVEPTWDGSEAKALADLLRATPGLTLERFERMLEHRAQSDVNLSERPRKWIASLPNYELGPLDAFGKPRTRRNAYGQASASPKAPDVSTTALMRKREDEEKRQILDEWRDVRERGDPEYGRAPGWVRQALEAAETRQAVV